MMISKHLFKLHHFSKSYFCIARTVGTKYSDKHKLSDNEIDSILRKKEKKQKQNLVFATEVTTDPQYEKDIQETLKDLQRQPKLNSNEESIFKEDETTSVNIQNDSKSKQIQVKYYKHGLPIPNLDPEIVGIVDPFERARQEYETPNQRLWNLLKLNENTPYDAYEYSLKIKYNNEIDMYGDIEDDALIRLNQLKEMGDGAIPVTYLENQEYMERMRRQVTVNFNMPGAIELEHPHKFLKDLRPIEEFRHTPLIPISERQLKEHQQKAEALSRRGFYFEIKKDTVYNWILVAIAMTIGFYMISLVIKKEEESGIAVERLRIERGQIGLTKKSRGDL